MVLLCCTLSYIFICCWNLQISLQSWTGQLSESIAVKRNGDNAFDSKDFLTAHECYSRVSFMLPHKTLYNSPVSVLFSSNLKIKPFLLHCFSLIFG